MVLSLGATAIPRRDRCTTLGRFAGAKGPTRPAVEVYTSVPDAPENATHNLEPGAKIHATSVIRFLLASLKLNGATVTWVQSASSVNAPLRVNRPLEVAATKVLGLPGSRANR